MRPVDLNNLLPNTQRISKVQQLENNKHKNFMHNQATIQNKKFENELKKVNITDKAFETKINKEQKNNKKGKSSKKNPKQEEKQKEKTVEVISDGIVGSKIDVKI